MPYTLFIVNYSLFIIHYALCITLLAPKNSLLLIATMLNYILCFVLIFYSNLSIFAVWEILL